MTRLPWNWPFEPTLLLLLAIGALLYWWGTQYSIATGLARHLPPWRRLCFGGGLLGVFLALQSPIDVWATLYLWAHMVQHLLLIYVAAPLLLLAAPLMPTWRALPLDARRSTLRWLLVHRRLRRAALSVAHFCGAPGGAWLLFVANFLLWHLPAPFDLALRNQIVHDAEHVLFLATAMLFWAQIIPSVPLRPRLGYGAQACYAVSAGFATQIVALALTYSVSPIYTYYVALHPGGVHAALVDQSSSGALMDLVGVIVFGGLFMLLLWRWFDVAWQREASTRGPARLSPESSPGTPS
jgi:cytochrome c oxidase assembly factor CtaG